MPEISIKVGGRPYLVACQSGEEAFLEAAAEMLNSEAMTLSTQISRVPESRMLLMSGLLLADKTAAAGDKVQALESEIALLKKKLSDVENAKTEQILEVPVVPASVTDTLAELSARAEAMADRLEEKLTPADQND